MFESYLKSELDQLKERVQNMIKHRGFFLLNMEKGFDFFAYFDPYEAPNFESDFANYILTDPDVKRVDLEKKKT